MRVWCVQSRGRPSRDQTFRDLPDRPTTRAEHGAAHAVSARGQLRPRRSVGDQLFLAGKGYGSSRGKLGRDLTVAEGYEYARSTGTMLLSVIQEALGSLDKVTRIVKVVGMVNATPEFSEHPKVVDGCSDLLVQVFGEAGRHARTSIGVASTPNQIPVEIDMVIEFADAPRWTRSIVEDQKSLTGVSDQVVLPES